MGAFGLQTHIWNNNIKSAFLLAGFPVLLLLLIYALNVGYVALAYESGDVAQGLEIAFENTKRSWPFAFMGAGVWFAIAWMAHQSLINMSTGAKPVTRAQEPDLYNMLENLCISRGVVAPKLQIVDSPALNAFASGLSHKNYAITLTRGIVEALDADELEAVMAHELTHIRNRDVRLLVIAVIFVGVFSFFAEIVFRGFTRTGVRISGHTSSRKGDSRGGGILILVALALIALAYFLAMAIRFSLSQKREYLADAGSVDLTKNPDAMISALKKISGRSAIEAPQEVRQMMLDNTASFAGLFATHPSIEKRIEALHDYAGGR
ncbi:MAG: M48 family metallopeptidase [Parvularculaceae bacterium]|nr:M48 family metallopeptidase [Parvularculaceae bacterium]